MAYSEELLNRIYDRTDGYCHICGKRLSFVNYGKYGRKGAWQVEHSLPKAKGGTDHPNNLYAACSPCNWDKWITATRTARSRHSRKKAPLSKVRKQEARARNTLTGAAIGLFLGARGGLVGMISGAVVGGVIGSKADIE
jgi:5-methylcytosine-specific restriction endonuclease McrA